ncbi:MAG: peroxiredoxin family protein, partial [Phycisphaerae bacterium]
LNAPVIEYEGVQPVNGTDCHVIGMTYDEATGSRAKLYIGTDDYLLRRKETPVMVSGNAARLRSNGAFVFNAREIKVNPAIDEGAFRLIPPPGYKQTDFKQVSKSRTQRQAGQGIQATRILRRPAAPQIGNPAPEWSLKDTNGKTVRLKDLQGKVVVLDFWASWCGPCRKAMPGLQKLHERFKDQPVAIYGVNCREKKRDFDTAAFIKKQGFTYPQLTNGNGAANAYGVRGIPAFFIIGKDGKIAYSGKGFHPRMETLMGNKIEEALK